VAGQHGHVAFGAGQHDRLDLARIEHALGRDELEMQGCHRLALLGLRELSLQLTPKLSVTRFRRHCAERLALSNPMHESNQCHLSL
jgi:hypothetical protein